MASDGVTEPTLRQLAREISETLPAAGDDGAEVRFYADHLLPALQSTLASLADLDIRYEIECDHLKGWSGPDEVRQRLIATLDASWRRDREPIVQRLIGLEKQIRAPGRARWS